MDSAVLIEVRVFFLCGLCGVACGIVYDLFRILRRCLKMGAAATFIMDLLFWLFCSVLTFLIIFYANNGLLRGYELLAVAFGALLYFLSIGAMVVDGGVWLLNFLFSVLKWIVKVLLFPIVLPLKWLCKPIKKAKAKISRKIIKNRLTLKHLWFRIKKRMEFFKKLLRK